MATKSKTTSTDQRVWRGSTRIKVTHYGGTEEQSVGRKTGRVLETNKTSDVIFMHWQKDVSSPTGHMTMQVLPRQAYLTGKNRIRTNDLLVAEADARDGSGMTVLSYLLVDRVSKATTIDGKGGQHEVIQVACSDFGKVLEETSLIVDPSIERFTGNTGAAFVIGIAVLKSVLKHSKGRGVVPNQAVFDLFQLVLGRSSEQFRIPNSDINFADLVSYDFVQKVTLGATIVTNAFGLEANTKLWGILKQYSNEFLNELFVDVRYEDPTKTNNGVTSGGEELAKAINQHHLKSSDTPLDTDNLQPREKLQDSSGRDVRLCLIMRQRPYDFKTFRSLTEATVYRTELMHDDFGVASHEAFNLFRVFGLLSGQVLLAENNLLRTNPLSIRRNGVKRFEPETIYIYPSIGDAADQADGKSKADFSKTLKVYTDIISIWNATNDTLYAGTVTLRFRPDIRVGQRLVLRDSSKVTVEAYIQALTHEIHVDPKKQSTTTLTLVRGVVRDNESNTTTNVPRDLTIDLDEQGLQRRLAAFGFKDTNSLNPGGPVTLPAEITGGGSGDVPA